MRLSLDDFRGMIEEEVGKARRPARKGARKAPAGEDVEGADVDGFETTGSERTARAVHAALVEYFNELGQLLRDVARSKRKMDFYNQVIGSTGGERALDDQEGSPSWDRAVQGIISEILGPDLEDFLRLDGIVDVAAERMQRRGFRAKSRRSGIQRSQGGRYEDRRDRKTRSEEDPQ